MLRSTTLMLLVLCAPAWAQEDEPLYRLATVNVTATRTLRTADEALASVTVIERNEIERLQPRSVSELIRGLAGISVATTGGAGKDTYVFLRGSEPDHVLVLVDGVKVGSATTGMVAFQDLPVDAIERIEIVRGPCSSLYGSEAIGGVIQIITRSGHGALTPEAVATGGGYRTYGGSLGIMTGGRRASFAAVVGRRGTDGFNAQNGFGGAAPAEPDRDGYKNFVISARAGLRVGNAGESDVHYLRSEGRNFFDGSFVNEARTMQEVLGARVQGSPAAWDRIIASVGTSQDRSSNFNDGVFRTRFDTRRYSVELQNDIDAHRAGILTTGIAWQQERIHSTTEFTVVRRNLGGVFGQYQVAVGRSRARLSIRRDAVQGSAGRTTGTSAWGHDLGWISLMASYATAFKAPTFNELYYPGFGNLSLRSERSRNLEAGLARSGRLGRASVSAFENKVEDLIAYDAATGTAMNLDRARLRGVEAQFVASRGSWQARGSATLMEPRYRGTAPGAGSMLPLRARRAARLDLDRSVKGVVLGATLLSEGQRYDDLANTVILPSYATLGLRLDCEPLSRWRIQVQVENVLDGRYQTVGTYNQAGRNISVTLRVR